jgi:signal peptidase II
MESPAARSGVDAVAEPKVSRFAAMPRLAAIAFGPLTPVGAGIAIVACLLDQALKYWLLFVFDIGTRGTVVLAPVLDLVLVWNSGISYGLLQQTTATGRWILLGVKAVAVILLWGWLARTHSKLAAVSLGLIIGGALGNAIDRLSYGAVVDFVLFHIFGFNWYVFNLADAAIVAGVGGLLYESLRTESAAKAP